MEVAAFNQLRGVGTGSLRNFRAPAAFNVHGQARQGALQAANGTDDVRYQQ
jgi:hypothetical protein